MPKIKTYLFTLFSFLLLPSLVLANTVDGALGPWADSVVEEDQGLTKGGDAVASDRSDSTEALGEAESFGNPSDPISPVTWYSLGFGGEITLMFENGVVNGDGDDLMVYEVTGNTGYPLEQVMVEVSQNGSDWTTLTEGGERDFSLDLGDLECVSYVRITDTTDPSIHNNSADGYDLDAVEALNWSEEGCETREPMMWEGDTGSQGYWKNHEGEEVKGFVFTKKVKGDACKIYGNQFLAFHNNYVANMSFDDVDFVDTWFDSMGNSEYDGWTIEELHDLVMNDIDSDCSGWEKDELLELKDALDLINNGMYIWY